MSYLENEPLNPGTVRSYGTISSPTGPTATNKTMLTAATEVFKRTQQALASISTDDVKEAATKLITKNNK